jgi:hypothetical protein
MFIISCFLFGSLDKSLAQPKRDRQTDKQLDRQTRKHWRKERKTRGAGKGNQRRSPRAELLPFFFLLFSREKKVGGKALKADDGTIWIGCPVVGGSFDGIRGG